MATLAVDDWVVAERPIRRSDRQASRPNISSIENAVSIGFGQEFREVAGPMADCDRLLDVHNSFSPIQDRIKRPHPPEFVRRMGT
jgi:hypothetical protein